MTEALCKGSWRLGTACGRCAKCIEEAQQLIPLLIAENFQMREVLTGLHEELMSSGRLVSNPRLTARAIGAVINENLAARKSAGDHTNGGGVNI